MRIYLSHDGKLIKLINRIRYNQKKKIINLLTVSWDTKFSLIIKSRSIEPWINIIILYVFKFHLIIIIESSVWFVIFNLEIP